MKDLIKLYRDPAIVEPVAPVVPPVEPPVQVPDAAKPVDLSPKSASTTVDLNTPVVKVDDKGFVLPDAFKDKPYLKGVKSVDEVYKMLDGAQELIGKKGPAVPKADAPQAEKDAYYESIGRPKTAAEYTSVLVGADKTDPKVLTRIQEAFHKAGLTPDQAKLAWEESTGAFMDYAKEKGLADAQADVDFDKLAANTFGVDRDKVLARGKELVDANISPAMKEAAKKLDNNAYVVLADILRNIDKKYISPDGAPLGKPTATGMTPADLSNKARNLMAEQSKFTPMSQEFNNLQKQIDECYDTMRRGTR